MDHCDHVVVLASLESMKRSSNDTFRRSEEGSLGTSSSASGNFLAGSSLPRSESVGQSGKACLQSSLSSSFGKVTGFNLPPSEQSQPQSLSRRSSVSDNPFPWLLTPFTATTGSTPSNPVWRESPPPPSLMASSPMVSHYMSSMQRSSQPGHIPDAFSALDIQSKSPRVSLDVPVPPGCEGMADMDSTVCKSPRYTLQSVNSIGRGPASSPQPIVFPHWSQTGNNVHYRPTPGQHDGLWGEGEVPAVSPRAQAIPGSPGSSDMSEAATMFMNSGPNAIGGSGGFESLLAVLGHRKSMDAAWMDYKNEV